LKKEENEDDDYRLALAMSLSQNEADEKMKQKRKFNEEKKNKIQKIEVLVDNNENLLDRTAEAIERFMNRAKSNCE
jgi:uncharacterized membrane protein